MSGYPERIAVSGYIGFAERLALGGLQNRAQVRDISLRSPFDLKFTHEPLWPFLHVDPHRELAELALVIVFDLGGDIRLAEAVGVIEVAYRIKIVIQQFLGVAAGAVARKNRRRHQDALAQSGRIEKLVPGDFDVHQLVARVARHAIVDHLLAVFRRALVEIDVCLEVPKRL